MPLTGPAVMFVNTRPTRFEAEPPFWAAASLGLPVVILGDVPPPVPDSLYAEYVQVDTYDFEAVRRTARAVAARRQIAGVVCWGDRDVEGVAHIAEELGLPGNSVAAAQRARNKRLAREALAAFDPGLVPAFAQVAALEDLPVALERVSLPAVLKPAGASASKGIFTVTTAEEAEAAARQLLAYTTPEVDPIFRFHPRDLILESFLHGSEHSVEGIVVDGHLVTATITDKFVESTFSLETHQMQPSVLPQDVQARCLHVAQVVADALGLGTTVIHLELKVTPDEVKVIELNSRTGGAYITTHLIGLTTGYPFLRNVLSAHCNLGPPTPIPPAYLHAGSRHHLADGTGRLQAVKGIDVALAIPGVVAVVLDSARGRSVAQPPADFTSAVTATVLAAAGSRHDLRRILDEADGALQVQVG